MKTIVLSLVAVAATAGVVAPAQAAESREVVSGTQNFRAVTVAAADPIGQTFTAFSDTLSSVGFQFITLNPAEANSSLTLSIYAGEALSGTALFSSDFTLPASVADRNTPQWVDVVVPELAVTMGETYSLVLNATSNRAALVLGPGYSPTAGQFFGGDAYADGKLITNWSGIYANCSGAANNCDANFRVTGSVLAAAVPEPASWALMILGFGAMGGLLRRRRHQQVALKFV